jgi:dihydrofolate synthase/folylpolyglutamate synthase
LAYDKLVEKCAAHGIQGVGYPTVMEAYKAAQAESSEDDLIYVGGSTFVVASLLEGMKN